MTDTRSYLGFRDVEKILVQSYKSSTGGCEFDIDKYGPYIDAVRCLLVPSLEKQILFFLERFVYSEDFQQSSCQRYLTRYKESMLTACTKYNEIGTSIEAMRELLTINHVVDFLGHSLLTNSRLAKISDDLNAMGIEKNWLGYVNVLNYINERDFWVCSSSSSNSSRQFSSFCSLAISNNNIPSEANEEKGSYTVEQPRGHKRPRKRAATHINRKHYKLERVAQLSDKSFRVTESLYNLLKSNWYLHDSLHAKQRLKRNCGDLRRSTCFPNHSWYRRKTDWKNESLTFVIRKIYRPGSNDNNDNRNSEIRTSSSLPCRVDQLLCKLGKVEPSLTRFHCSSIKKKFQIKLYNVCSCLNNLLSRMDVKMINSLYLICEIRKDYLNFKLKQTSQSKCNSSLFFARVMTCEALYRYGISKSTSRQKLKSQSFWFVHEKANDLSSGSAACGNVCEPENNHFPNDEPISSIEINFTGCEGSPEDQQDMGKGLTHNPEDSEGLTFRNSLSISDVIEKLKLSPFCLEETEQSFRIRSKIQDIIRSIMICTQDYFSPSRVGGESISVQAILSTSSLQAINSAEVISIDPQSHKKLSLSKVVVSFIESKIHPSGSEEIFHCNERVNKSAKSKECREQTGSSKSEKSAMPESCLLRKEQSFASRGSVRLSKSLKKSRASSSSREAAKLKNKNKYKICTTSEKPIMSKESTEPRRRPLSKKIVESIASEISNALARTKSDGSRLTENIDDYDIDVTIEIQDGSKSSDNFTESFSRHTHILPSMKSVRCGTNEKYFPGEPESSTSSLLSSSSESELLMFDNYTTMGKSMVPSSKRGTISAESYNRIKKLIREKVCKKLSETDSSCQPNSSKTIVSSGKYYLSIPSSKTSRVPLKREISESSSTSQGSLKHPVSNRRGKIPKPLSSDEESLCSKSSTYNLTNSTRSSRAATFDKNSVYGCIEDRLANRYFRDIVNDYSDESENSPRQENAKSDIFNVQFLRPDRISRYGDSEITSEENETDFSRGFATDDDACTNISWTNDGIEHFYQRDREKKLFTTYVVGSRNLQETPRLGDYDGVDKIEGTRRATGWSTCAIRSSSSRDCSEVYPPKTNYRMNMRDRGDSQEKTFAFDPWNIIEKYKKRFQNIDKNLRAKITRYVGFCKNVKNNFQKQVRLDDIYEASGTSIPQNNFKRHKYNGVYFTG